MKIHHALLALALLGCPAYAQNPDAGKVEFEAGVQLMQKGEFKAAEDMFREGLKLAPHSVILLYNAGSAALNAGRAAGGAAALGSV